MDLRLSEEQRLIVDSAAEFLSAQCTSQRARSVMHGSPGWDADLWHAMASLGWCGIHLPVPFGGSGLGMVELSLLQEQLGQRLACVPFFDSVALAATALRELTHHPLAATALSGLAAGDRCATIGLPDSACPCTAKASPDGQVWVVDGEWQQVGSAHLAHDLMLTAHGPDAELLVFWLPASTPGLSMRLLAGVDTTRTLGDVTAKAVRLDHERCLIRGPAAEAFLARVRCLAAIALAAEQVGIAQQALDMTLAYVQERRQFERSIASFQAIKHRCAQMLVMVETARSAVYGAACTADTQPDAATLLRVAAQARTEATQAALFCTREAIQLHGGVGFTWEYDPHLYLRRAQACSQRLGHVRGWCEAVARQLLDCEALPE